MEREYFDEIVEAFLLELAVLVHFYFFPFWMFPSRFTFFPSFGWKTGYFLSISPFKEKNNMNPSY